MDKEPQKEESMSTQTDYKTPCYIRKCQERYRENNKEKIKEHNRKYFDKLKQSEEGKAKLAAIRKRHRENLKNRENYESIKQTRNEYMRLYRLKQKEKKAQMNKE